MNVRKIVPTAGTLLVAGLTATTLTAARADDTVRPWLGGPMPVFQKGQPGPEGICAMNIGSADENAPHVFLMRGSRPNVLVVGTQMSAGKTWQSNAPMTLSIDGVPYALPAPGIGQGARAHLTAIDVAPYSPGRLFMHALWNGGVLRDDAGDNFPLTGSAKALDALTKCTDFISGGQQSLTPEAPSQAMATGPVTVNAPAPVAPAAVQPASAPAPTVASASAPIQLVDSGGGGLLVAGVINGTTPLIFTLDTGASEVVLPLDIIQKLQSEGALTFLDSATVKLADGREVPARIYRLSSLTIGGYTVHDVYCGEAPAGSDPLLGQSFLRHFPSVTIDNASKTLKLG